MFCHIENFYADSVAISDFCFRGEIELELSIKQSRRFSHCMHCNYQKILLFCQHLVYINVEVEKKVGEENAKIVLNALILQSRVLGRKFHKDWSRSNFLVLFLNWTSGLEFTPVNCQKFL